MNGPAYLNKKYIPLTPGRKLKKFMNLSAVVSLQHGNHLWHQFPLLLQSDEKKYKYKYTKSLKKLLIYSGFVVDSYSCGSGI
jgi:hypothetical protein